MLLTLLIVVLWIIAYQDLRYRSVSWILFPVLAALSFIVGIEALPITEILVYIGFNLTFVALNIAILYGYLFLRYKVTISEAFASYIGIGDLLFWVALVPLFSTINFIYLYLFSIVVSVVVILIVRIFPVSRKDVTVPLAGLQALFYSAILGAVWCGWKYEFYNDLSFIWSGDFGKY